MPSITDSDCLSVVCQDCFAAVGAKCTEKKPTGGHRFVDWFHFSRIEKAREKVTQDEVKT